MVILKTIFAHTILNKDVPLIMDLYKTVYPDREQPTKEYWAWCFGAPIGYVAVGIYGLKAELVGYYAALLTKETAIYYSAMVHPTHRNKGLFGVMADKLHEIVGSLRDYGVLFANEDIVEIHEKREGFVNKGKMIEYRKNVGKKRVIIRDWYLSKRRTWRDAKPGKQKYKIYEKEGDYAVFNIYKNSLQIVDYSKLDKDVLNLAEWFAQSRKLKTIVLWCEHTVPGYKKVEINTWLMHKIYRKCKTDKKIRMVMSDVY